MYYKLRQKNLNIKHIAHIMRSTNKFYKIIFNSMHALIGHKTILHERM